MITSFLEYLNYSPTGRTVIISCTLRKLASSTRPVVLTEQGKVLYLGLCENLRQKL